jgi:hypothetical protein
MQGELHQINFQSVGIKLSEIEKVEILRRREAHLVCRVKCIQESYILKWFFSPSNNKESYLYSLLNQYEVDTLPVYKLTECAILLEDLQSSAEWRLANDSDMRQAETGKAIANWYLKLHRAGRSALKDISGSKTFLTPWVTIITRRALQYAADVFDLKDEKVWETVFESFEILKAKYLEYPQTFNYNDFAAENLALARAKDQPLRAVIFDYDQFSTGLVYSDFRNVLSSLTGEAAATFRRNYDSVNESERYLDEPLDTLHGLIIASQRKNKPAWVAPFLKSVSSGELEASIDLALRIN